MSRLTLVYAVCLSALSLLAACDQGEPTAIPFTIELSPEFVQGAIPGAATGVLVTITNKTSTDEPVQISAAAEGAKAAVEPAAITDGDVAEVTVIPDPTTAERPLEIVVTGVRGELEDTATKSTTVLPWEDDRAEQATEILGLFTSWLGESRPELGVTSETEFDGTYLAPELLVVSHYGFFNDQWEIGVSWHVMIPPDDFAEIYLRDRSELRPSLAFRIGSWQTALENGDYEAVEVEPPFEVVR